MSEVIVLDHVSKSYTNGVFALQDFSLTVRSGEIFGFLGPNGAGKTTTIKMLLGFMPPTSGMVRICGGDPQDPATRCRIGYLPEVADYYRFLTVRELLEFYGRLTGLSRREIRSRSEALIERVGLGGAASRPLKTFSKGMLQRAGIAQALLHQPELLILDEPMTGLDPLVRAQFRDIILEQKRAGRTVFFSSHELSEAEMVCDRVGILRQGRLCWCGPTREVAGDGRGNLERVFLSFFTDGQPPAGGSPAAEVNAVS